MPQTYTTLQGEYTVSGANTATRTGVSNSVAIVGGYDADNAASGVTAGETNLVENDTAAEGAYGTSELPRAIQLAAANGVSTIYAVPVAETEYTESFAATASFTLSNAPLFDPTVHPDHSVTVTDTVNSTDLSTNYVYGTPTQPSSSDTANINPITGAVETDASSDYDVTYHSGDYTSAIQAAARESVRNVVVCTEAPSHKSTLATELGDVAQDGDFKRGFTGATPEIASTDANTYTPATDDWRVVEVAPARAQGADGEVRLCAGIGGYATTQPVGPDGSMLFDTVSGVTSLNREYRTSTVKNFDRVVAVARDGTIGRSETTSTTPQFEDIYATEIIDRVVLDLSADIGGYAGGPQDLEDLRAELETTCQRLSRGNPPLLGFATDRDTRPYDIGVSLGASNEEANADVTVVPYPVAEAVNLSLTVADGFVEFGGATA